METATQQNGLTQEIGDALVGLGFAPRSVAAALGAHAVTVDHTVSVNDDAGERRDDVTVWREDRPITLQEAQAVVKGPIEVVCRVKVHNVDTGHLGACFLVVNENGLLLDMPVNISASVIASRAVGTLCPIVGPALLVQVRHFE